MNRFAAYVAEFIEAQGHRTDVSSNEDGSISHIDFRTRGIWITASTNENDRGFLQISCSIPIPEQIEIDKTALEILLGVQDRLKAIKFATIGAQRRLVGNIELLFESDDGFKPVFWQSVGIIEAAMREAIGALEDNSAAKSAADKFIKTLSIGGKS